jgi:predicted AAA+ superfamily ATPase
MYYERALVCPEESFFLLGPRGTGKSTWLRHQLPDATFIDLLDERQRYRLMSQPGAFALELQAVSPGAWVIVDEIQKMPDLLNEVRPLRVQRPQT